MQIISCRLIAKMKILKKDFVRSGRVEIIPDKPDDDFWFLSNFIVPGDTVTSDTPSKVVRVAPGSGCREKKEFKKVKLEIRVESVDDSNIKGSLTIHGKNILKNEIVKIGQSHPLTLEPGRPFVLTKLLWDKLAIESLKRAADPSASAKSNLADTKTAQKVLGRFGYMCRQEKGRACYGPKHVEVAAERKAVETLLITDELFRSPDRATRKRFANLVKTVEDSRGKIHVFSSVHALGEQLAQYTGVAAILRSPALSDLDDFEM